MMIIESDFTKLVGRRPVTLLMTVLVSLLLSACVTTTTGGFSVDASDDQAAADYIQLALAYFDNDDMSGARRHVNNALDIDDRTSDAYMVLAMIFEREGDLDLADENFRRAISLNRDNSRARNNYAAMLFSHERYEESFDQLQIVANDTSYEGRALAFEGLGRSALRLGRKDEARAAFQRALQLNSNLYISALEASVLFFEQQNYAQALQYYRNYLTIVEFAQLPHSPRALLAGIEIEGYFQNADLVERFALVLSTLYPDSPEYRRYRELSDAN